MYDIYAHIRGMSLRIREIRKQRGLTIQQLADMAGMSRPLLNEFELGRKSPNTRRMEAIARALEIQPAELFPQADESPRLTELINAATRLSPDQQRAVLSLIRSFDEPNGE